MGSGAASLAAHSRRQKLKLYAVAQLEGEAANHCDALAKIADHAAMLVGSVPYDDRADEMVDDLEQVLIGTDMTEGRGKGNYFVGNYRGATGFKPNMRDRWNQVQHATAGVVIGYKYWRPVHWLVNWLEEEPQDKALYDATFKIGRGLHSSNVTMLGWWLRRAIGDNTCK